MIIDLEKFIVKERPIWSELETTLSRLEEGTADPLTMEDVKRLHYLYERTSADLSRISNLILARDLKVYLEALVSRSYSYMHESRKHPVRFHPLHWFGNTFPITFRRHARCFFMSCIITLIGFTFGGAALLLDPDAKEVLMPFHHLQGSPNDRVAWEESAERDRLENRKLSFSSHLMTHNTRISILAMALGMTWALGTIILLFYNGVILGAVIADYIWAGEGIFLTGWLLPHGSVEIPAILIAGQAGLVLGRAIIGTGSRISLRGRLRALAPDLVTLIGGVACLLVWAGIVESFFSQYHAPILPYAVKTTAGSVQLILLFIFLAFSGRRSQRRSAEA